VKRHARIFAGWLAMVILAGMPASAVTLSNAVGTANQLQFTIIGVSNASYTIEGSTNLQQWRPVVSNREFGVTRTVTVSVAEVLGYYRARVVRPFEGALAARGLIELRGNNIQVDSFNSVNPLYSTAGRYDPAKRRDSGHVATSSGLTNSLRVGSAKLYGKLSVGPGGGVTVGPSGCVGSLAYVSDTNHLGTIQPGWLQEDARPLFPDATLPALGSLSVPTPGTVGGTNYTYVLGNQNYSVPTLTMSNGTMMVTNRATLWVQGNFNISGSAKITIAPGGSLIVYVGEETGSGVVASIGGAGIVNQTSGPLGFQYYGLRSNVSVMLSSLELAGTIYAPNADVWLNASGSLHHLSGAAIAKTITVNGNYQIHYDENVGQAGPLF